MQSTYAEAKNLSLLNLMISDVGKSVSEGIPLYVCTIVSKEKLSAFVLKLFPEAHFCDITESSPRLFSVPVSVPRGNIMSTPILVQLCEIMPCNLGGWVGNMLSPTYLGHMLQSKITER